MQISDDDDALKKAREIGVKEDERVFCEVDKWMSVPDKILSKRCHGDTKWRSTKWFSNKILDCIPTNLIELN